MHARCLSPFIQTMVYSLIKSGSSLTLSSGRISRPVMEGDNFLSFEYPLVTS
jgi:hypothetical protein